MTLRVDSELLEIGRSISERVPVDTRKVLGEIGNVPMKRKCQIVIN
jgi:hypothetical protein